MTEAPTPEQIDAAMKRARDAAHDRTRYPDRIAEFPHGVEDVEAPEDGWFHIGWIGVVGELDEWLMYYNPATDQGRSRAAPKPR
jgi:hypothetical protein